MHGGEIIDKKCPVGIVLDSIRHRLEFRISLGEAERPENFPSMGRPLEPDPGNPGVGNGNVDYFYDPLFPPFRDRGFFWNDRRKSMRLTVNGTEYTTEQSTLAQLLKEMGIIPERVAVEVNLKIIKKKDFVDYRLMEGDSVEIVYFVGGGEEKCVLS